MEPALEPHGIWLQTQDPQACHLGTLCVVTPRGCSQEEPPEHCLGRPQWANVFHILFLILTASLQGEYPFSILQMKNTEVRRRRVRRLSHRA